MAPSIDEEDLDCALVLKISDSSDNNEPAVQQIKTEVLDGTMIDEEDLDCLY